MNDQVKGRHAADGPVDQEQTDGANADADARATGAQDAGTQDSKAKGTEGLSALAMDAAHPFDQTNGIVDGLEGDADDPENVEGRLNDTDSTK